MDYDEDYEYYYNGDYDEDYQDYQDYDASLATGNEGKIFIKAI